MRRWLRWTLRGLAALLVLVVAVAVGGFAWLRTSLPQTDGRLVLAGLAQPVEIRRDRDGVPTIVAADPRDAIRAQGFVHAQDRLFQMDFMRVLARGRLAEFVGAAALPSDRLMRALDLAGVAERSVAALAPETRDWLDAYAAGVNAFLESRGGAWPPEFLLTGRRPEPWRAADTLLWGQLMALQLSGNWRDELLRLRLMQRLPADRVALLWPDWPADAATSLAFDMRALEKLAAALPPPLGGSTASNGWVVDGARSATGKPILANDPHLGLVAPSPWYLIRLEAPGLTLAGASAPGVPGVVLGRSARVAWGMTTTGADTNDLFVERVVAGDATRYVTPEGSAAFAERRVTIKVKDAEADVFAVRSTRHGIVISDLTPGFEALPQDQVIALATTLALEPDRTADAFLALNRARNLDEALAALARWRAPVQNVFLADVDGHVGLAAVGAIPLRRSGEGWLARPGWTGEADWDGFAPFEAMPRRIDPPSGVLVNANNRLVPDGFQPFISRDWDAPYRARRIADELTRTGKADLDSIRRLQTDSLSIFAAETGASSQRFGTAARDRSEPLIFNAWMRGLQRELARAAIGDDPAVPALGARERPHLVRMAFDGDPRLCGTFDCQAAIARSLREATEALARRYGEDRARWRWGDAHRADFPHALFARTPIVGRWLAFGLPTDGDNFTVNRGTAGERDDPTSFPHVHGPTLRAIYDLADLDRSLFMIAPGQTGNPLSPHWGDLATRWADGVYRTLGPTEPTAARLTLVPR